MRRVDVATAVYVQITQIKFGECFRRHLLNFIESVWMTIAIRSKGVDITVPISVFILVANNKGFVIFRCYGVLEDYSIILILGIYKRLLYSVIFCYYSGVLVKGIARNSIVPRIDVKWLLSGV